MKKKIIIFIFLFITFSIYSFKTTRGITNEYFGIRSVNLGFKEAVIPFGPQAKSYSDRLIIGSDDAGKQEVTLFLKVISAGDTNVNCEASGGWNGQKILELKEEKSVFDHHIGDYVTLYTLIYEEKIKWPATSTSYKIICKRENESITKTASIEVQRISVYFKTDLIILGEEFGLRYELPPAATFKSDSNSICTLNNSEMATYRDEATKRTYYKLEGEIIEKPADDKTYFLKCTWHDIFGWSHQSSLGVRVKVAKLNFDIFPTEYFKETNQLPIDISLSWESRYFQKCEASSNPNVWFGEKPLNGQEIVKVNKTTSFTLTCSGLNNDFSRKQTITKTIEEKSLCNFPIWIIADKSEISEGEEVIVSWMVDKDRGFDACRLIMRPYTPILAYSTDYALEICGKQNAWLQRWASAGKKGWQVPNSKFTLTPKEYSQYLKDPTNYQKIFSIETLGTFSLKVSPKFNTLFTVECKRHPREIVKEDELHVACTAALEYPDGNLYSCFTEDCVTKLGYTSEMCGRAAQNCPYQMDLPECQMLVNNGYIIQIKDNDNRMENGAGEYQWNPKDEYQLEKTNYEFLLVDNGINASASITIKVLKGDEFKVSLSANPTQIYKGEKTTLTYSSINGSSSTPCIATSTDNVWNKEVNPDSSGKTSGEDKVTLNEVKTYNFFYTCYDKNNQSKTATAKVEVSEECKPPKKDPHMECVGNQCKSVSGCDTDKCTTNNDCKEIPLDYCRNVTISASPQVIFLGRSTNLTWSSQDCDSCIASCDKEIENNQRQDGYPDCGNWQGNIPTSGGPKEVTPLQKGTYYYKITCFGKLDQTPITQEAEVKVKVIPIPYWHEIIPVLPGFLRGLFGIR